MNIEILVKIKFDEHFLDNPCSDTRNVGKLINKKYILLEKFSYFLTKNVLLSCLHMSQAIVLDII